MGSEGSMIVYDDKFIIVKSVTEINPNILKKYDIQDTTGAGIFF